jgi:hypothetical protein
MKKLYTAIAILALAGTAASAQNSVVDNPANKSYFGLRLGGEITCPGKITSHGVGISVFDNGGGVELGGIYNTPLVANLYLEPGVMFYYNTYSYKDDMIGDLEDDIIFEGASIRKFGMRVPVMLGYHFDFTPTVKLSLFTGPELEIGFSAKEHITGHNIEMSQSLYDEEGGMHRVDLLWGIGAGFTIQQFYVGVKGSLGLLNMYNYNDISFHENRVTLSVGYNF